MWPLIKMLTVFFTLGIPAGLTGIVISLFEGNVRTMYAWGKWITAAGVRAAGIEMRVDGVENFPPDMACIILSNHMSNLDPPVQIAAIPGMMSIMLKKSLMRIPILGTAMGMAKFIPISRGASKEDARRSVQMASEVMRSGRPIVIYPEGTRSADGRMLPFKRGAFFLAEQTGCPIIPTVVSGTAQLMPKGSMKIRPGKTRLQFLPPVFAKDFATQEELMATVRAQMEAALNAATLDVAAI